MKNLARLILFFTFHFILIFLAAGLLGFLSSWIEVARIIQAETKPGQDAAEFAWKALPAALYLSVLVSLSYSARRKISVPASILAVIVLAFVFTGGFSVAISGIEQIGPVFAPVSPLKAGPGLMLSRSRNTMILLKESGETSGPRVVSLPERPLIYQARPLGPNNTALSLPALPLGQPPPWLVESIGIDFSLCAAELKGRLGQGLFPFCVYAFSLILFLSSLRFLLELSKWPMANIILGALVFRGILALEVFLNAYEVNALIFSFLKDRAPPALITPLVFSGLGILVLLYTLLTRLARIKTSANGEIQGD